MIRNCFLPPRLFLFSAAMVLEAAGGPSVVAAERPNIVVLLADDLGWADLSSYGSNHTATPHIDRIGEQGIRFTDFYAASGVCSPSRAALLTGRNPIRAGVYRWIHDSHTMHLRDAEVTLAELLAAEGYATAHFGKWHLNPRLEEGELPGPAEQGFDYWFGTESNAEPSHRNPENLLRIGVAVGLLEGYAAQLLVDDAIRWLNEARPAEEPFFLNVWFHEPHRKVAAPARFAERHRDTDNPEYYGCIENMDAAVGRLLEALEASGAASNTLVLFTSDNGSYQEGSNGRLRGSKAKVWEGGIRVPALLKWPGRIEPGQTVRQPFGLVDVLPTLCAIADASPPADRILDGVDISPLFAGEPVPRVKPLYIFQDSPRPVAALRLGDYNMVAYPKPEYKSGSPIDEAIIPFLKLGGLTGHELYNLREDIGQTTDIAGKHPEVFDLMKLQMDYLHRETFAAGYDWSAAVRARAAGN